MTAVVVAAAVFAAWVVAAYWMRRDAHAWQREVLRHDQDHARERRELLDRLMYMADRPWTLPPQPPDEESSPYVDDAMDEPIPAVIDYDAIIPADRV